MSNPLAKNGTASVYWFFFPLLALAFSEASGFGAALFLPFSGFVGSSGSTGFTGFLIGARLVRERNRILNSI